MKIFLSSFLFIFLIACNNVEVKKNDHHTTQAGSPLKFYSRETKDSVYVFISTPKMQDKNKTYPVVYMLDANLHFDIMAATFERYSEVGLLPEAILVGIGYKDFKTLDSLRYRDLTFPTAIPEYEMPISGKADKFLDLIQKDIVPFIDANYACNKEKRVLMGHSLGGYFTLFALNQNLLNKNDLFSSYIAASPSTDYNHSYLLKELDKLKSSGKKINCYVTFGGLEDAEEPKDTDAVKCAVILERLQHSLKENCGINYKGDLYSSLDHMNMPLPSFVKGLQTCLMNEER